MLLNAKNITKIFSDDPGFFETCRPTTTALSNVSFEVQKAETLGIVGESGCGKTTLARILSGLIRPSSGSLTFDTSIVNPRRDIQLVAQNPFESLDPLWTIGNTIKEPLTVNRSGSHGADRIEKVLERVHLKPDILDRKPIECSGGQRQRVALARALVLDPKILICDEPTSYLDLSIQAQILNLLLEMKAATDLTLIFISHDLAVIKRICDRILVMHSGIILDEGTCDEITRASAHPYTRFLLNPREEAPWP